MRVSVLDVAHGLCVVVRDDFLDGTFVYDCGTHGASRVSVTPAWRRLNHELHRNETIEAVAVSHLHWDHYCGFLEPIARMSRDVAVYLPRLPQLIAPDGSLDHELRSAFALRLLAWQPTLDPAFGPLDISLMRSIRRYAPEARPIPVSASDSFAVGGNAWEVLWPPAVLRLDEHHAQTLKGSAQSLVDTRG